MPKSITLKNFPMKAAIHESQSILVLRIYSNSMLHDHLMWPEKVILIKRLRGACRYRLKYLRRGGAVS